MLKFCSNAEEKMVAVDFKELFEEIGFDIANENIRQLK